MRNMNAFAKCTSIYKRVRIRCFVCYFAWFIRSSAYVYNIRKTVDQKQGRLKKSYVKRVEFILIDFMKNEMKAVLDRKRGLRRSVSSLLFAGARAKCTWEIKRSLMRNVLVLVIKRGHYIHEKCRYLKK